MSFMNTLTPEGVAELMGIDPGTFGAVGWLMMQEEAAGVSREMIAKQLGVSVEDLGEVELAITTEKTAEESAAVWGRGVVALQTQAMLTERTIGKGWDSIEAMAVSHLHTALANTKNGDPEKMLTIAVQANKAMRRIRGENRVGSSVQSQVSQQPNVSIELQSGNLGVIQLNISPQVLQQMTDPSRMIEGVAKNAADAAKAVGSKLNLGMLNLKQTREFGEEPIAVPAPPPKVPEPKETRVYDFSVLDSIVAA